MLISPPFLPKREENESDEAYVRRSMTGDAPGAGAFPVSYQNRWHGGLHLTSPFERSKDLDIRAIADGILVYRGDISKKSDDPTHPLNYGGGWTSDGCIVLKHSTEIGEGESGKVEFYSVYHHLRYMPPAILEMAIGQKVWRKDPIGSAGYINNKPNFFHFEIIADDVNARKLMGRIQGDVPLGADGRKDACYGDIHFYLPASTTFSDLPSNPHGVRPTPREIAGPGVALFVSMHFEKGYCTMTTYREDGALIGATEDDDVPGAAYEYQLYETATKLYPQQPAAGFELLRFGRVLGTADTLIPANAQHWRKIALPSGKLWVNLNGAGVIKLSDADFPHWLGWRMVDASHADLRCADAKTLALLTPEAPKLGVVEGAAHIEVTTQTMSSGALRKQCLARTVAKFLTDWDYTSFDRRLGWLKNPEPDGRAMSDESYARLKKHSQAVSFWTKANLGMDSTPWHFDPREFILHFKKCGWLSREEFQQVYPKATDAAVTRYREPINRMFAKYLIVTVLRQSHFLGQAAVESAQLRYMSELYNGDPYDYFRNYESSKNFRGWLGNVQWNDGGTYRGRGFKQLTGRANYASYFAFRGRLATESFKPAWWNDARWWGFQPSNTTSNTGKLPPIRDARLVAELVRSLMPPIVVNPDAVSDDTHMAVDTAGYFWAANRVHKIADHDDIVAATNRIRGDHASAAEDFPEAAHFPDRREQTYRIRKILE